MIEFVHLNTTWNAEPNAPCPRVEVSGVSVTLLFYMNAFKFKDFSEGDIGALTFSNCFQYRMGPPNDEGFNIFNQSRYKKYGVPWGEFYLVKDSDWQTTFPNPIIVASGLDTSVLNHYLFYLRDETFECIAGTWHLEVSGSTNMQLAGDY